MSIPARTVLKHTKAPESETAAPVDLTARSVAMIIVAFAAAMWLLSWAREVFIPIVLSVLISYALEPVVGWLMRIRVPRVAASALVITLLAGSLGYGAYSLSDDAAAIVAELPDAAVRLRMAIRRDSQDGGAIQQVQKAAEELQKTADEAAGPNPAPSGVQRVQIEEPAIDVRQYVS